MYGQTCACALEAQYHQYVAELVEMEESAEMELAEMASVEMELVEMVLMVSTEELTMAEILTMGADYSMEMASMGVQGSFLMEVESMEETVSMEEVDSLGVKQHV